MVAAAGDVTHLPMRRWGAERRDDLLRLWCRAVPGEPLTAREVDAIVVDDPGVVLGTADSRGAVAAVTRRAGPELRGHVRLLVVHPEQRRRGVGRALLAAAESWLREQGATQVVLGADAPVYLWPGLDATNLPAQALALSCGYSPASAALNLRMDAGHREPTPRGLAVRRVTGADADRASAEAVRSLVSRHWPPWSVEVDRGIAHGTVFAAFDEADPITAVGFGAHSTLRDGWVGPMGTDPGHQGRGVGGALLSAICADLGARGHATAEIAWVGPLGWFADRGAVTARVFRRFAKPLVAGPDGGHPARMTSRSSR